MPDDWRSGGFGLYVHWPFCEAKCPYCDFNSHVARQIDHDIWLGAYLSALDAYADETPGRVLNSVYFGGGTPSLMAPRLIGAILDKAHARWTVANDLEVTLEANPSSVEAARFEGYHSAGVNRVSLGVQALNDDDLRRLGRLHDADTALFAFELARSVFDRVSFDLIYARQHQSLADWESELRRALSLDPDHLSLYQLTIEDGTAFGNRAQRGKLAGLPDEDLAADMFELTRALSSAAGLPAYEVSNHAKPGEESRHNLIYWRGGDYVGVGPGAHGRITLSRGRFATETPLSPSAWLESVAKNGSGEHHRHLLSRRDHASEYLMMSLRTREGLDLSRYERILGKPIKTRKIHELRESGLVVSQGNQLVATERGVAVLNAVVSALLPD